MKAKCPFCNVRFRVSVEPYSIFDVLLGEYETWTCTKCGEVFYPEASSRAMEEKEKELGLWGLERSTKVSTSGNALMVRIPKRIQNFIGLRKGTEVVVRPEGRRRIVIEVQ